MNVREVAAVGVLRELVATARAIGSAVEQEGMTAQELRAACVCIEAEAKKFRAVVSEPPHDVVA